MAEKNEFLSDEELQGLFDQIAPEVPAASDELMARILTDAENFRPVPGASVTEVESGSFWNALFGALGGWKGAGGLVTAGLIGLWVGVSPPTALETTTSDILNALNPDLTGGWADYSDIL